jgi:hypothetical protein
MAVAASAFGSKGPHVAHACGQPLGRSMDPRQQRRLAAESAQARADFNATQTRGGLSASLASTNRQPVSERRAPFRTTAGNASSVLEEWHRGSRGSGGSGNGGNENGERKKSGLFGGRDKTPPKPKSTPALDAYRASNDRARPRYSTQPTGGAEAARLQALRAEEKTIVTELSAMAKKETRRKLAL